MVANRIHLQLLVIHGKESNVRGGSHCSNYLILRVVFSLFLNIYIFVAGVRSTLLDQVWS